MCIRDRVSPAEAASARSVEGVRRGQSDIWPYPMARSASPAASAHVGKPLDPSSRAQADSGFWGGFACLALYMGDCDILEMVRMAAYSRILRKFR